MQIDVAGPAFDELRGLAAAAYPDEGCGVLMGSAGEGRVTVVSVTSGRNLRSDRARDRYELDPGDIVRAERAARDAGLEVVGFWHSHPDHPAAPSPLDAERAWPDYVYVICATTASGTVGVRAHVLDEAARAFAEAPLGVGAV